jgi:hypothetical protein
LTVVRSLRVLIPFLAPVHLAAQSAPVRPLHLAYRGFALRAPVAEFSARAQEISAPQATPLICNTSRRTAQLMECGALVRDPVDSAGFYVAAYVLEGRVAFLSFGDSGSAALVERTQHHLESRFGRPHASRAGMWEWRSAGGREVVRLTWRGRGAARWIYIALWDEPLMDRISRYVPRAGH